MKKLKSSAHSPKAFKTNRRIRLGIWGLGRGRSFYRACSKLNIDVVAGCDYNEHMRQTFLKDNPGAFATNDVKAFLKQDIDAVVVATFCPNHADDAIRCLRAGKHVLSEVMPFHTPAQGVRLVEEVEKSGLVYNLAENYPYSANNMYLADKWREGLFGQLAYAEFEYVHETASLLYTYIDGQPIARGDTVHNWRSWYHPHYYSTHSLGPVMHITKLRPTRVVSLPGRITLPGYLMRDPNTGMGRVASSLITMSNGALVRNLVCGLPNDTKTQRLWGTHGGAEQTDGKLSLRLGGRGNSPKCEMTADWSQFSELARSTGHSGGDFWTPYFFAREILEGKRAFFDVYNAADCTLAGIFAYRSQKKNGKPYDIPDFRKRSVRNRFRKDHAQTPRYDVEKGVFPRGANHSLTKHFSRTVRDVIHSASRYRAYTDWLKVEHEIKDATPVVKILNSLVENHKLLRSSYTMARKMIRTYPRSDGARVLSDFLEIGGDKTAENHSFLRRVKRDLARLKRNQRKA